MKNLKKVKYSVVMGYSYSSYHPYIHPHKSQLVQLDENNHASLYKYMWKYHLSLISDDPVYPVLKEIILSLAFTELEQPISWLLL